MITSSDPYSNVIPLRFFHVLQQWMKPGFTTTYQRLSSSPNSGWKRMKLRQGKRQRFHLQEVMAIAFLYSPSVVLRKGRGIRLNYWTN